MQKSYASTENVFYKENGPLRNFECEYTCTTISQNMFMHHICGMHSNWFKFLVLLIHEIEENKKTI